MTRQEKGFAVIERSNDVVVVGGGQAALALGFYLRRSGLDYGSIGTAPRGKLTPKLTWYAGNARKPPIRLERIYPPPNIRAIPYGISG